MSATPETPDPLARVIEAGRSAELCARCNAGAIIEECYECVRLSVVAMAPRLLAAVVAEIPLREDGWYKVSCSPWDYVPVPPNDLEVGLRLALTRVLAGGEEGRGG